MYTIIFSRITQSVIQQGRALARFTFELIRLALAKTYLYGMLIEEYYVRICEICENQIAHRFHRYTQILCSKKSAQSAQSARAKFGTIRMKFEPFVSIKKKHPNQ